MLRQYNEKVKIRVFIIDSKESTRIDYYANQLGIDVVHRPSTKEAKEQNYFCLNRQYLNECPEESVLHIDGDTFIFGDIEILFDKYKNVDFAAATDDYIINSPDWSQDNLNESYCAMQANPVPVFNGGLTLWNNFSVRGWADSLADICTRLQMKEFPITPWLFGENRNCYHKETFAICFYVARCRLRYEIMDKSDVVNLFSWAAYNAWQNKNFIVYHTFTQNWKMFYKDLMPKKKIANLRVIASNGNVNIM